MKAELIFEVWKPIPGYVGFYEVSNFGRVKSLNYKRTGTTKILKPKKDKYGYLIIHLSKNGLKKYYLVHRLVAMTFIPNPDNLPQINHRNEIKTDNSVWNLEWCDTKYNCNYWSYKEKQSLIQRNNPKQSKLVYQYTLDYQLVRVWPSSRECGRNGFDRRSVIKCCLGKQMFHKGFIWSYVPLNNLVQN